MEGEKAPPDPKPSRPLDPPARTELEGLLWKRRAMALRVEVERGKTAVLRSQLDRVRDQELSALSDLGQAEREFKEKAASFGIDVTRDFEVAGDGHILYLDSPPPSPPG